MFLGFLRRASSLFSLVLPLVLVGAIGWFIYLHVLDFFPGPPDARPEAQINTSAMEVPVQSPPNTGDATVVQVGDTLQVTFYERLMNEEDKWMARSHSRRPPKSFQQRAELSGDYEVRENGVIVIPLLGSIKVAGRTISQFETDAGSAFERLVGRFAFVSVALERKPIYLVGPVKKPGAYKYTAGMTVLHLVAMAGGFDRTAVDLGHMIQAVHEVETQQKSADLLKRLWARLAVLEADRDAVPPSSPRELVAFVGEDNAMRMIEAEKSVRGFVVASRRAQEIALAASMKSAKRELESKNNRRKQVEANVRLRGERIEALRTIQDKVSRPIRAQAEAEWSDVKERLQEADVAVREAETKLHLLDKEQVTLSNQSKMDLEQEILTLKSQITEASSSITASAGALDVMRSVLAATQDGDDSTTEFEIVRGTTSNQEVLTVSGTASLNPGDLVRIKMTKTAAPKPPRM